MNFFRPNCRWCFELLNWCPQKCRSSSVSPWLQLSKKSYGRPINFPQFSLIFLNLNYTYNIISNNIEQFILYFRTLQGFRMKENTFKISKSIIVLFACTKGGGRHTTSIIHHLYQASEKDKGENWRKLRLSRKLLLYP